MNSHAMMSYEERDAELQRKIVAFGLQPIIFGETDIAKIKGHVRYNVAEDKKGGFFRTDGSSQTTESDIVEIKEVFSMMKSLTQDTEDLKRQLKLGYSSLEAKYESEIQQKTVALYEQLSNYTEKLRKDHDEKVETVRRAYRQQLTDALKRLTQLYERDIATRLKSAASKQKTDHEKSRIRERELQSQIQSLEATIRQMEEEQTNMSSHRVVSFDEESVQVDLKSRTQTPKTVTAEPLVVYKEDSTRIAQLEAKIVSLQRETDLARTEAFDRTDEARELKFEVEKCQKVIENKAEEIMALQKQIEEYAMFLERNDSSKKMLSDHMERFQRDMEIRLSEVRKESYESAESKWREKLEEEQASYMALLRQKQAVEKSLSEVRAELKAVLEDDKDYERMRANERRLTDEVKRLSEEVGRTQRMWETKFLVLQQSLHALKDESFLRHQMQRQSAQLHTAAVSYVMHPIDQDPPNVRLSSRKPLE